MNSLMAGKIAALLMNLHVLQAYALTKMHGYMRTKLTQNATTLGSSGTIGAGAAV